MTPPSLQDPAQQEKYTAIIAAAVKVFARDGLHKGKIADVAMEAGVGKGTVYEYFRSKDEIFMAILNQFFDQIEAGLEHILHLDISADRKVALLLEMNLEDFKKMGPEEVLIFIEIWAQSLRRINADDPDNALALRYKNLQKTMADILEQGVAEGIFRPLDSQLIAMLLGATLDGLGLYYLINQNMDIDKLKQVTPRAFLEGILVRSPTSNQ